MSPKKNPNSVTVTVPATSANIGPGFDSFGIAFELANLITVNKKSSTHALPPIVQKTADFFFKKTRLSPFPFSVTIKGDVPPSRGLGSSATLRLGVLMALNYFSQSPLQHSELYSLCDSLEGHPDNAAAAVFGGFTIARKNNLPIRCNISPELKFVLLIPNFEVTTEEARLIMPKKVTLVDASSNIANAAVIAAAFSTGSYDLLRGSFDDCLHQPYRKKLVPFLPIVLEVAESKGALGGWLSGSGSTIVALAPNKTSATTIAAAMKEATPPKSKIVITSANNEGAKLIL